MLLYRLFRLKKYGEPLPESKKEPIESSESPVFETQEPLEEVKKTVITVTREKRKRDVKKKIA